MKIIILSNIFCLIPEQNVHSTSHTEILCTSDDEEKVPGDCKYKTYFHPWEIVNFTA